MKASLNAAVAMSGIYDEGNEGKPRKKKKQKERGAIQTEIHRKACQLGTAGCSGPGY